MSLVAVLKVGKKRAEWWKQHMSVLMPEFDFFLAGEAVNKLTVEFAIVWNPEPGWLKTFPNLKCIVSIGSGIDHILADPSLPKDIPIIRTTGKDLNTRMREYIILQVLRIHRKLFEVERNQKLKNRHWILFSF